MASPAHVLDRPVTPPGPIHAVLPQEDPSAFDALARSFLDQFQPSGPHESFLVDQMIHSRWRILRLQRLELCCLGDDSGAESGPDRAILANLRNQGDILSLLQRLASAAERSYYRAHKELTASRATVVRTDAASARKEAAEAEKQILDYLNAPIPAPPFSWPRPPLQNTRATARVQPTEAPDQS